MPRRSSGSSATNLPMLASSRPYDNDAGGATWGSSRHSTAARTAIMTAARTNGARLPAGTPETVRASRIPVSKPLITIPTTWPRRSVQDSVLADGIRIWTTTGPAALGPLTSGR
jgi:hypothetical protein